MRLFFAQNRTFVRSELIFQVKETQGVLVTFLVVTKDLIRNNLEEEG